MTRIKTLLTALLVACAAAPGFAQVPPPVPALPDTDRITAYTITAQTGPFNVGFAVYGDSTDYSNWLEVWLNGVKLTGVTDWTLASATGPLASIPRPITNATVTLTTARTGTLQIVGARRPRRAAQFGATVPSRDLNQVLTDIIAGQRERWDSVSRYLRTPPGDTLNPLPAQSARALTALGFDAAGQPISVPYVLGLGTVIGPVSSVNGHVAVFSGTSGQILADGGPSVGTVSSVGLALPNIFTVTGSPVTTAGTLTGTLATQSANTVWAGPTTGAAAAPGFRALVGADLPNPSASTLGGVQSKAAVTSQWLNSISTSGVPASSQPSFSDISGSVAAAQLPNPSATTLGGVQSKTAVVSQWINSISTAGVPSSTQPAFTDISGTVATAQIANNAVTNAQAAQMGAATFKCNPTVSAANGQDCTIQGLTARGPPDATNDKVPIYDNAAGTIKYVTPNQIASSATAGVSSLNGLSGALSIGAGSGISVSSAGATVTVTANTVMYDTVAAATAATISNVPTIYIRGYATAGDRGAGWWTRSAGVPGHTAYFQSADSAYWSPSLANRDFPIEMFGGKCDSGTTNNTTAYNKYLSFINSVGTVKLTFGACYYYGFTTQPNQATTTSIWVEGVGAVYPTLGSSANGYVFSMSGVGQNVIKSMQICSIAGKTTGNIVEFWATAGAGSNQNRLDNLSIGDCSGTHDYSLMWNGAARTTGAVGIRDQFITNIFAKKAYIYAVVGMSWYGGEVINGTAASFDIISSATFQPNYIDIHVYGSSGINFTSVTDTRVYSNTFAGPLNFDAGTNYTFTHGRATTTVTNNCGTPTNCGNTTN